MYKKLLSVVALIVGAIYSHAMVSMGESPAIGCSYPSSTSEFTDDFESYSAGVGSYINSASGISFMLSGNLKTQTSFGLGINGSMNYVDNANDCLPSAGVVGSIRTNPRHDFYVKSFWIFPSQDCIMNGTNGSIIIRGKKDGLEVYSRTINSFELNDQQGINNGFTFVDMSLSYCGAIDQLEFEVTGSLRYVAIDDFQFMSEPIGGADPLSASITSQTNVACNGGTTGSATVTASGGVANYSYSWSNGASTTNTSSTTNTVTGLAAGSYSVTVTDSDGGSETSNFTITEPAELIVSKGITNASCAGSSNGAIDLTVSGGTEPFTYEWEDGPTTEDRTNVEPGTYSVTVTDDNDCSQVVNATVGDNDETDPEITCAENITIGNDEGSCSAVVNFEAPSFSDNCTGAAISQTAGLASGSEFPLGTTTNTFVVTDASGNTATCSFTVTVNDTEAPGLSCPGDIETAVEEESCNANVVFAEPVYFDNCPGGSVAQIAGLASGSSFPIGSTTNTFVATDAAGNTDTCSFQVIVSDLENPIITAPENITVAAGEDACSATEVMLGEAIASDNCSTESVTNDAPATFPLGETVVTWTVVDASGNEATDTQLVTVEDNQNPTITAPETVNVSADEGSCEATEVMLGEAIAADNCSTESVTNDAPESFPLGETVVTWTVTDGSGNSATATQTVVVEDNENPTIIAPEALSLEVGEGMCGITEVVLGEPEAADNCTVESVSNDAPEEFSVGETVVTWTVTDAAGNVATATQSVLVEDNEVPVIEPLEAVTATVDSASCEATSVELISPEASDNCTIDMISNNAPMSFPIGTTTVTWTAIDASGNTATATQDVIVEDNFAPVPDAESLEAIESMCAVEDLTVPSATDNCAEEITGVHDVALPITETSTITWTFDDGNGNVSTQTQEVMISNLNVSVTATETVLTANIEDAEYQWYNCENEEPVEGADGRSFDPEVDGEFFVMISKDGCSEASDCYPVFATGVEEFDIASQVSIFPNPNNGDFSITFSEQMKDVEVKVTDLRGRVISKKQFSEISKTEMQINEESGIYLVHIKSAKGTAVLRVVKNN